MKSLILLATAAALVSATAAEAKGLRIRIGGPKAYATAPTPKPVSQTMPGARPLSASQPMPVPQRATSSGGVFIIPGAGVGASRASASSLDQRRGLQSDWQVPEARQQATPEWFKAAAAEAARSASPHEQSMPMPRPQKASYQCPPGRLVGGFCVLN